MEIGSGTRRRRQSRRRWRRSLLKSERPISRLVGHLPATCGLALFNAILVVAVAYVMQKTPYVFPILGGRKVEQLYANIQALDVALSDEHIKRIEAASPFDKGFNVHVRIRRLQALSTRKLITMRLAG